MRTRMLRAFPPAGLWPVALLALACGSAQVAGKGGGTEEPATVESVEAEGQAEQYIQQAGMFLIEGDNEGAMSAYIEAADLLEQAEVVSVSRADARYEAAQLALEVGERSVALEQYDKSVKIYLRFTGNARIKAAVALTNLGALYKELTQRNKARNCWEDALQIYKEAPPELQNSTHIQQIEQNIRDLDQGF